MAMFVCRCGRRKSGQPHKDSNWYPWMCDNCAPSKKSPERKAREVRAYKTKTKIVFRARVAE